MASNSGLTICENHFNYLVDLRLEDDIEMNFALKNEAIKEIKEISKQLHKVNMLIIEDNRTVLGSSLNLKKEKLALPKFSKGESQITTKQFGDTSMRMHVQVFSFLELACGELYFPKRLFGAHLASKENCLFGNLWGPDHRHCSHSFSYSIFL